MAPVIWASVILEKIPTACPGTPIREFNELVIGLQGSFTHRINRTTFSHQEAQCAWIREKDFHELNGHHCTWANIALHPDWIKAFQKLFGPSLNLCALQPQTLPTQRWTPIRNQIRDWHHHHQQPDAASLRQLLFDLFDAICSHHDAAPKSIPWWIERAQTELAKLPIEEATLSRLQKICHRSPEHISRSFQEHLACSPSTYLNRLRLTQACRQLTHSDLSVTEIAYACGFQSLNYFFTCFRKTYRMSPSEYRRQSGLGV
ncbi:MAG: helix-turn-helix transcriptional regulator [Blastochloris sp.]|nr:helix-turn-helix transcriptional regulator [Blastochloris sp.]